MLISEEQAREKSCPYARRDRFSMCIASACALWVEIEPGKGVMACNHVMATWAIWEISRRESMALTGEVEF